MDFLDDLAGPQKKKRGLSAPPSISQLSSDEANQAAGGKQRKHGRKKQLNTRIPAGRFEQIMERIKEHSDALGITQNDVQFWALMRGLEALDAGERPRTRERKTSRVLIP